MFAENRHSKPELESHTIVSLKLDFAAQNKGGMAVSAVWTLVYLLVPLVTKEHANAHRRDALCPSPKIQKQAAFGIRHRNHRFQLQTPGQRYGGPKAISYQSYQSVTKYVSSWLYGGAQQQSRRRRSVAVIWCQALGGIRMASPGLTGRMTPSISMVPAPSRMK